MQETRSGGVKCEGCNGTFPGYDIVHYGSTDAGYRQLCTRCFNAVVAGLHGLDDFENIQLEPIGLIDCIGEEHNFHFRTRLLGGSFLWKPLSFARGTRPVTNSSS
jgi:hypothetical protein